MDVNLNRDELVALFGIMVAAKLSFPDEQNFKMSRNDAVGVIQEIKEAFNCEFGVDIGPVRCDD